jgi:hypothetical protein
MKTIITFVIAIASVACISCQQEKDSKQLAEEKNKEKFENPADEKDAQFVVETASALHTLIALADVALEKESKKAVATANAIKPDFQNMLGEVEAYAASHVISIPTEATEKSTDNARKLLDENLSEFDEKWCSRIRGENKDFIGKLESYGEKTKDMNIRTWLNNALPEARAVQDKLLDLESQLAQK